MPCEVLVRQLQPMLMAAVASGSVTIRQVCDVLYRASLAQPSSRLVLPTHKMPKVKYFLHGLKKTFPDSRQLYLFVVSKKIQ